MTVREYIGARYIPLFCGEWDNTKAYESLSVVTYQGDSYTSMKAVPVGVDISNESYWLVSGIYNAQIEQYRNEVKTYDARIEANADAINNLDGDLSALALTVQTNTHDIGENAEDIAANTQLINQTKTELERQIESEYKGKYAHPTMVGILRVDSHRFDGGTLEQRRAQGFCLANDTYYILNGRTEQAAASLYTRNVAANSTFSYFGEINTYHSSDIIYIPDISEFWISKGADGVIYRYNSSMQYVNSFVVGSSATLLAYDKKSKKVYAHDYWGKVYEINPSTLAFTDVINSVVNNGYKQSIAAHNGILYIMYSYPAKIISYDIATGNLIDVIFIGRPDIFPLGENEGMDTDSDGNLYITGHITAPQNSVILTNIYMLNITGAAVAPIAAEWRTNCYVGDRSTLFYGAQTPNGVSDNPFATMDEAILFMEHNPNVNQVVLRGDHSKEQAFLTFPVIINGESVSDVKPNLGRVQTTAAFTFIYNVNFKPLVEVANFIYGYRNGPISYASISKSGSHTTPSSGHDIQSNYALNTSFTNNADIS